MIPLKSLDEEPDVEVSNESTALQIEHDTLQEVINDVNNEVIISWGTNFYTVRLCPKAQFLTLLYTILTEKVNLSRSVYL